MTRDAVSLRRQLRAAGLAKSAVDAAWPEWWSDDAERSISARAELRLAVASNLGLSPTALVGERVEFVWRDRARYKNLATGAGIERDVLGSFGTSVGRGLQRASPADGRMLGADPYALRDILLQDGPPDLAGLVAVCWALGVPVAHLHVWPLARKAMHAMVVGGDRRQSILLARSVGHPAQAAFTLAHEMGHAALGHVPDGDILVDAEDPAQAVERDAEELAADRFALTLLLGDPDPEVTTGFETFNHVELADAALRAGPRYGVDPGTLVLAVAHRSRAWPIAMAALKILDGGTVDVSAYVTQVARSQIDLARVGGDRASFLSRVIGLHGD